MSESRPGLETVAPSRSRHPLRRLTAVVGALSLAVLGVVAGASTATAGASPGLDLWVFDPDREPVAGAEVVVTPADPSAGLETTTVVTDATGRARAAGQSSDDLDAEKIAPGEYHVEVTPPADRPDLAATYWNGEDGLAYPELPADQAESGASAEPVLLTYELGTTWGGFLGGFVELPVASEPEPESPFSDVTPTDFFGVEILALHDAGIIGGYPDGTFRNIASVNRDAMAAFMYRMVHPGADKPVCSTAAFVDVPASHPFCGEIAWLAETGVTTGWPDGTFRPSAPVTREAMAAFMYRLASGETTALECQAAPFVDVSTGHPFCGAIRWMAEENISKGWPNGTFLPGDNVQRQAMAAFLYRFMLGGFVPETV